LLAFAGAAAGEGSCPIPAGAPDAETPEAVRDREAWSRELGQPLPDARRLDPARVPAILARIETPQPPESWWDRLLRRFAAWLQSDEAALPQWFTDFARRIPPWVGSAVVIVLVAGLALGLLAVVIIELRAAGVFRRRRSGAGEPALPAGTAPPDWQRTLDDIARLPLRERPAALLAFMIRRLVARDLLPADSSLTNGELAALLGARAPAEVAAFRRLARAAEAVVYGAAEPGERDTRELLDALRAAQAGA
jgi:hypothetical protein